MGGSLVGDKVGGHNVLEPAALGVPIITGPSYYNFSEIIDALRDTSAVIIAPDYHVLAEQISNLILSVSYSQSLINNALNIVKVSQGTIVRTLNKVVF